MVWYWNDVAYDNWDDLMEAIHGKAAPEPEAAADPGDREYEGLVKLLEDKEALRTKTDRLFAKYAGRDRALDINELKCLLESLSASLLLSGAFEDLQMMFVRFDFNCNNRLNEVETYKLVKLVLRQYRDSVDPNNPAERQVAHKSLNELYEVGRKCGEGGFGKVYMAKDRASGQATVIKYFDKSNAQCPLDTIVEEFEVMLKFDHPKIARTFAIFQDPRNFYVVSEPLYGGDLTKAMTKATGAGVRMTSSWLANIWMQTMDGIAYLHSKYVMHCDIKENNVMISNNNNWESPNVVVIDFGQAQSFGDGSQRAGTPMYMAPEVWTNGLWTPKGDVFSLGVMYCHMWSWGQRWPYSGSTMEGIRDAIIRGRPDLGAVQNHPALCELIGNMVQKEWRSRPLVSEVQEHAFFKKRVNTDFEIQTGAFCAVSNKGTLYRALMAKMATKMNLTDLASLNAMFIGLDKDGNGKLTSEEIRTGLRGKKSPEEIEDFIKALVGEDGHIKYTEFMAATMNRSEEHAKDALYGLFQELDKDNDGHLDPSELKSLTHNHAFKEIAGGADAESLIDELDKDKSGQISWNEFCKGVIGKSMGHASAGAAVPPGAVHTVLMSAVPWKEGDKAQYHSSTHHSWIPCTVVQVKGDRVMLDVKKGFWFSKDQATRTIRRPQ